MHLPLFFQGLSFLVFLSCSQAMSSAPKPAFYLSATHKSSGKTTLSIGLLAALRRLGHQVQSFKKGPDYIDPLWLAQASDRPCYNLDFNTQSQSEVLELFGSRAATASAVLVEGNKGLYDGVDPLGLDSNAAMARLLGLPVVLVLDCRGVTRGVAPLLLGYRQFDPEITIAGVILNQVGGPRHESKLRAVIEHYTDIPVLGAIAKQASPIIEERHLGLVPSNEAGEAESIIERLADTVAAQVDLERLLALVFADIPKPPPAVEQTKAPFAGLRIGIARDSAFGFYYADDLETFEQLGAELVFFSPLSDARLPQVDGIFLGGGFPETHMVALAANSAMLQSVRDFIEAGRPAYAECGGLMYLCRSLTWGTQQAQMTGVIKADAVILDRPQGRGYVCLKEQATHPWPGGEAGQKLPVHEFHYSRLENLNPGGNFAWQITRGDGIDGRNDGLIYKGLLAGYAHQRHVSGNPWIERFLAHVANHT